MTSLRDEYEAILARVALDRMTSPMASKLGPCVALVPCGSIEPHGPHLPLDTDLIISRAACALATEKLEAAGHRVIVAASLAYGVTECAAGFAGALSISPSVLSALVADVTRGLVALGATRVCFVNNHLEPEQDAAIRAGAAQHKAARVACPLTKQWARQLTAEFKSGACHAGQYETSLVLHAAPGAVLQSEQHALPSVDISLSDNLRRGVRTFLAMGMTAAYAGSPAQATAEEGARSLGLLADMIVNETLA